MQNPLILPLAFHVAWTALLYALLTIARAPAVWGIGRRADGSNPWATLEPRIGANLRNQFEWPLLFYVACLLLLQQGAGLVGAHGVLSGNVCVSRTVAPAERARCKRGYRRGHPRIAAARDKPLHHRVRAGP